MVLGDLGDDDDAVDCHVQRSLFYRPEGCREVVN
jgi:hypothetical protein